MSAYAVFILEKTLDNAEMKIYHDNAAQTLGGHPGRPLAAYGKQEVLEGPESEGIVIVEFPTVEAAKAWYDDPATVAVRDHRLKGGTYRGLIVEGV